MGGSIRVMAVLASAVTTNSGSPLYRFTTMALAVKTGFADPMRIVPEVRSAVLAVNPRIALADTQSMDTIVSTSTARIEFTTTLLGVAAAIALLLSALGLYGVVGYAVNRRTREIGVRIAVGAGPGQVEGLFVRQALVLAGFGLLGGVALALATTPSGGNPVRCRPDGRCHVRYSRRRAGRDRLRGELASRAARCKSEPAGRAPAQLGLVFW
jgi:hypothetical protein